MRNALRYTEVHQAYQEDKIDWDRVRLVIVCFTSRSEMYPGVPVRRALNVTINSVYFIRDATVNQ